MDRQTGRCEYHLKQDFSIFPELLKEFVDEWTDRLTDKQTEGPMNRVDVWTGR